MFTQRSAAPGVGIEDERAVLVGEAGAVADAVERVAQADFLSEGEIGAGQDVGGGHDRGEGVQDRFGGGQGRVDLQPVDALAGFGGMQLPQQVRGGGGVPWSRMWAV